MINQSSFDWRSLSVAVADLIDELVLIRSPFGLPVYVTAWQSAPFSLGDASKTMSESTRVTKRFVRSSVAIILCASAMGQEPSPSPSSMSPDKKWQYAGGDAPKIVQAGSKQVALEFERCGPGGSRENSAVLWAPDSRRLAFYGCGGKQQLTLLYQLRDEGWVALETPGDGDELFERVGNIIEGQAKKERPAEEEDFPSYAMVGGRAAALARCKDSNDACLDGRSARR
jgi:hypothetical protein